MDCISDAFYGEIHPASAGASTDQWTAHLEKTSCAPVVTTFSSGGKKLNKTFRLVDGRIHKQSNANLYSGAARTIVVPTALGLATLLAELRPNEALCIGRMKDGREAAQVTTRGKEGASGISRSLAYMGFPQGPGWLLIDVDTGGMPPDVAARIEALGGCWAALVDLWPELGNAARVYCPSSSQGVTAPECETMRGGGAHFYIALSDMTQAKATLDALHRRAWAAGLGFYQLSKAGGLLERSIVDVSVASPERLIFEAPPQLVAPVTREVAAGWSHEGETLAVLTNAPQICARADAAMVVARDEIRPAEKAKRQAFEGRQAAKIAKAEGLTIKAAHAIVRQRIEGRVLADGDIIDGPRGEALRIGDLLDNGATWHGRALPDPIEGIDYGRDKATFFHRPRQGQPDEQPCLVSHAHGIRAVYRFARHAPPEGTAPHFPHYGEPVSTGAAKHKSAIDSFFDRGITAVQTSKAEGTRVKQGERLMISGAQGIGKTATALRGLTRAEGLVSVALFPTLDKAHEAWEDYEKLRDIAMAEGRSPPPSIKWLGRSAKIAPDVHATMCAFPDQARQAAQAGLNVRLAMCNVCPLKLSCPYISQFDQLRGLSNGHEGVVVFAAHQVAQESWPAGVSPDLVVYDERPAVFLTAESKVPMSAFGRERDLDMTRRPHELANAAASHLRVGRNLETAIKRAFEDAPGRELAELRARGRTRSEALEAANNLKAFEVRVLEQAMQRAGEAAEFAALDGGGSSAATAQRGWKRELAKDNQCLKETQAMRRLLEAVGRELDIPRDCFNAVDKIKDKDGDVLRVRYTQPPNLPSAAALIVLDGTGAESVAQAMFGPRLRHEHIPVERDACVVHVPGKSFSRQSVTGSRTDGAPVYAGSNEVASILRDELARVIQRYPGAFVAGSKGAIKALAPHLPSETVTAHFGALRGLNRAENCEVGFVIGRELPPPAAIEAIARALHAGDLAPIRSLKAGEPWPTQVRGVRMRDRSRYGMKCEFHPDPRCNAILEQIREADIAQAIDRVRAMFKRRLIFILGNVPVDVTVDAIVPWSSFKASRVAQAMERGVLPLSERGAAKMHPDLWSDKHAGRDHELRNIINTLMSDRGGGFGGAVSQIDILIWNLVPPKKATVVRYRPALKRSGRGGSRIDLYALVAASPEDARKVLEARTGPLAAFEALTSIAPPPLLPPSPLDDDEAEERAAFLEADGISRRAAERIAREEMTKRQATPRRRLIWAPGAAIRPQLRPSRSATRYVPSLSGAFVLALDIGVLTSRTILGVSA
jgi:hypothetical protein